MHGPDPFVLLTVLTLGAALLVWQLQNWKLSPILGYLALGIVVAPFKEQLFGDPHAVEHAAEFGVILLMFFIGLEFHLSELRHMLKLCLGGGSLQVVGTAIVAGLTARLCGMGPFASAIAGIMISFSSTALVMKIFEDRRETDSQNARISVAILLLQDIAAILIVAVLPFIAGLKRSVLGGVESEGLAPMEAVARMATLFVLLPLLFIGARWVLPRLFERTAIARRPEAFSLLSLGACMLVALAAQYAGASWALGAFLGGLVLCQSPFRSQILADLTTLRNLSLAFFFVTVGMLVDLSFVLSVAPWLALAVAATVVLKTMVTSATLVALRVPITFAGGAALALAQVGEFSFVLGRHAAQEDLIPPDAYKFLLVLGIVSMAVTPFFVTRSHAFGRWLDGRLRKGGAEAPPSPQEDQPAARDASAPDAEALKAVVVGYGPVGRTLTRILRDFGIEPSIIEMNLQTVQKLNDGGLKAIYGDAGRREVLAAAGIEEATYLLITLPDLPGRIPIVATARLMNPDLKILSRARYLGEKSMLDDAGVTAASYEEAEVAVGLAGILLREVGADEEAIRAEAGRIRDEIGTKTGFTMLMPRPKIKP